MRLAWNTVEPFELCVEDTTLLYATAWGQRKIIRGEMGGSCYEDSMGI